MFLRQSDFDIIKLPGVPDSVILFGNFYLFNTLGGMRWKGALAGELCVSVIFLMQIQPSGVKARPSKTRKSLPNLLRVA